MTGRKWSAAASQKAVNRRRREEETEAHRHRSTRRLAAQTALQVTLFWQKINKVCTPTLMNLAEMTPFQLVLHKEAFFIQTQQKAELKRQLGAFA